MRSLQVPFFDLKRQHALLKFDLTQVWSRTVDASDFILGNAVSDFEKSFAKFIGTQYAVGVSSGLDALSLSLRALGVRPEDEVVVPAFTFIATALAVSMCGARPVLADIDDIYLHLDPAKLIAILSKKTKAVIPVHLYGQPADIKAIGKFCKQHRLALIEDAAQAHGASAGGLRCGSLGDTGCFSFYPSKNLGAFGDAGLVTTSRKAVYQQLLHLRNYGSMVKYKHEVIGFNHRLDTLQAGILSVKLKHLTEWNEKRGQLARHYDERLSSICQLRLPARRPGNLSVYHLYVVRTNRRDALKRYLDKKGVGTGIHYPSPIHLQEAYRNLGYKKGDFPIAEKAAREVISLPMYPEMTVKQVDAVCQIIAEFYRK